MWETEQSGSLYIFRPESPTGQPTQQESMAGDTYAQSCKQIAYTDEQMPSAHITHRQDIKKMALWKDQHTGHLGSQGGRKKTEQET